MASIQSLAPTREDFTALLNETYGDDEAFEGTVVKGKVVAIEKDMAVIDVGLKTEGRVALKEFTNHGRDPAPGLGDEVEVYLERIENALGEAVISRDKARREESWVKLEQAFEKNEKVEGVIFNQVKGGFTVDLDGAVAFLPRSQVDIRPVRDVGPLMNVPQPFQILKMDRRRGNIVVSRRTVLEESRAEQRHEIVANLAEGQVIDGTVKNLTDYGAFVDLGGIDGLLHVTDIAWRRVNHPSEVLTIGQQVKVRIIKINHETHRISLGMKQLQEDPWSNIETRYASARSSRAASPTSPTTARSSNSSPASRASSTSPKCPGPRRTSTPARSSRPARRSRCRCSRSTPPSAASRLASSRRCRTRGRPSRRRIRSVRSSRARSRTRPSSGCSSASTPMSTAWSISPISTGTGLASRRSRTTRRATRSKPRCLTSMSRRSASPSASSRWPLTRSRPSKAGEEGEGELRKGSVVTCEVVEVKDGGLEVKIAGTDLTAFIKRNELARDRGDQRPERFSVGEKVDARITQFDRRARKVAVSIKALEVAEEKEAIAQYGSADFGRFARRYSWRGAEGARQEREGEVAARRRLEQKARAGAIPGGLFVGRASDFDPPRASQLSMRKAASTGSCRPVTSAFVCEAMPTTARKSEYCASVMPFARAAAVCEWMQ